MNGVRFDGEQAAVVIASAFVSLEET